MNRFYCSVMLETEEIYRYFSEETDTDHYFVPPFVHSLTVC